MFFEFGPRVTMPKEVLTHGYVAGCTCQRTDSEDRGTSRRLCILYGHRSNSPTEMTVRKVKRFQHCPPVPCARRFLVAMHDPYKLAGSSKRIANSGSSVNLSRSVLQNSSSCLKVEFCTLQQRLTWFTSEYQNHGNDY